MASGAAVLPDETSRAAYFGFNMRREYVIEDELVQMRMWLLDPVHSCLPNGDRLFDIVGNRATLKNIFRKKGEQLDHYSLKPYFYDTADLVITSKTVNRDIKFRVQVVGKDIGGALTYADFGLQDEVSTKTFLNRVTEGMNKRSYPMKKKHVVDKLLAHFEKNLKKACEREIQEEGTPEGAGVQEYFSSLVFDSVKEQAGEWADTVTFLFRLEGKEIRKQRELDEFFCMIDGVKTSVFYIYGDRWGKRYTLTAPFGQPQLRIEPIAIMPNFMMNNAFQRDNRGNNGVIVDLDTDAMELATNFRRLPWPSGLAQKRGGNRVSRRKKSSQSRSKSHRKSKK